MLSMDVCVRCFGRRSALINKGRLSFSLSQHVSISNGDIVTCAPQACL